MTDKTPPNRSPARRRVLVISCGIAAGLLTMALWSCSKEDLALLEMAGYGVIDRISLQRDARQANDEGTRDQDACVESVAESIETAERSQAVAADATSTGKADFQ